MQQILYHLIVAIAVFEFLPSAIAHGHDDTMYMAAAAASSSPAAAEATETVISYFQYGEHFGLLLAHITLMTIAWVLVLPIGVSGFRLDLTAMIRTDSPGVMLSIVKSRYTLLVQFSFIAANAIALLLATIYNADTPDLYPNNAHHKLGWVLTWVVSAQVLIGLISAYAGRHETKRAGRGAFMSISTEAMAEHQLFHGEHDRLSNDSGQGTERNTGSLRSQSMSSSSSGEQDQMPELTKYEDADAAGKCGLLSGTKLDGFLSAEIPALLSSRVLKAIYLLYKVIDRVMLLLAFLGMSTGVVTYGGLFMGDRVFSGLAHFIKGGVFFWFGILTLGRWAGCFADIGWAWNINPSSKDRLSAEFVESLLIFIYGCTNVFMEHLNAWGKAWTAQDLEHISITFMFFGGGLLGMLIESRMVRELLNISPATEPFQSEAPPLKSYGFSMNPIPALVVMLVSMMMSSHHQESMLSTIVHKQWGTLLVGAAFARAATYVVMYLSTPTSILPGRPPTELITAFCLMAGGLIFMASARDSVMTLESYELDAIFIFNIAVGFITTLMAWILVVIGIKGWAVRKENRSELAYRSANMP
ncbi:integral membrane protein-like protein [Calycina marina]|uniref:Integral membrane protein-like protein n=1 Tax=Calycina marina TaxID=1763456 RepID=A0A9P7Z5R3_9HELO|nr:integral membrane protein-like protein [Calycina marina]